MADALRVIQLGKFTLDINRDDRGRIVAEVWHKTSGKTLAITECDTIADAEHWGRKTVELNG